MIAAAKKAQAHDFIVSLRDNVGRRGYDAHVGERGVTLSGGQRQRMVLARTLLREPEILVLDEATSALDAESEHFIQQSINDLKGKVTLIVISHRLSTVKLADRVLVMDKGSLIQEGTWDTLSDDEGLFRRFKDLQIM